MNLIEANVILAQFIAHQKNSLGDYWDQSMAAQAHIVVLQELEKYRPLSPQEVAEYRRGLYPNKQ